MSNFLETAYIISTQESAKQAVKTERKRCRLCCTLHGKLGKDWTAWCPFHPEGQRIIESELRLLGFYKWWASL